MNRTFTIIDSDTQRTAVIQSTAETVAELKRDLEANGFSVEGKTIQEGISRTEFTSDDSVLPHDVPRNGTTTNDLVFRLTKSNKNIKSGVLTRPEAYAKIKELGLGDAIKEKFGKNFTQCSTDTLIKEIEAVVKKEEATTSKTVVPSNSVVGAMVLLVQALYDNDLLSEEQVGQITKALGKSEKPAKAIYSQDEIDEMFIGM